MDYGRHILHLRILEILMFKPFQASKKIWSYIGPPDQSATVVLTSFGHMNGKNMDMTSLKSISDYQEKE